MSETTEDYVFLEDWLARQAEPLPDFGSSVFDEKSKSPLAIGKIPGREQETLFERKEKE